MALTDVLIAAAAVLVANLAGLIVAWLLYTR